MLTIKFFASLRERLSVNEITVDFAANMQVINLVEHLVAQDNKFMLLQEQEVLVAVNQTLRGKNHELVDNDEVAFFPPVTGG
jgi:molybdopterin synthase sulfur carrier subunit